MRAHRGDRGQQIPVPLDSATDERETAVHRGSPSRDRSGPATMISMADNANSADHEFDGSDESSSIIAGKYRLIRRIGTGASSRVYLARNERIRTRHFAIKILRSEHAGDPSRVSRFLREAETSAGLRSPYTIDVVDFGETDFGVPFFVMEFADGPDLAAVIGIERTLRPADVARFSLNTLTALEEAHGAGVVHRDLKPSNVFIVNLPGETHPVAKVADFGIAKSILPDSEPDDPSETQHGTVLCTPNYASPELLNGVVTPQCDIYALGHMMIEMLDGRVAYEGTHPHQVTTQHLDDAPVPLSTTVQNSGLAAVIARAVAKDPKERFATAIEMKRALEEAATAIMAAAESDEPLRVSRSVDTDPMQGDEVVGSTGLLLHGRMRMVQGAALGGDSDSISWGERATAELIEQSQQVRATMRVSQRRYEGGDAGTAVPSGRDGAAAGNDPATPRRRSRLPAFLFAALLAVFAILAVTLRGGSGATPAESTKGLSGNHAVGDNAAAVETPAEGAEDIAEDIAANEAIVTAAIANEATAQEIRPGAVEEPDPVNEAANDAVNEAGAANPVGDGRLAADMASNPTQGDRVTAEAVIPTGTHDDGVSDRPNAADSTGTPSRETRARSRSSRRRAHTTAPDTTPPAREAESEASPRNVFLDD